MTMTEREQLIRDLLGRTVLVKIDRPIGYNHKGLTYPVNYGYIPGIIAGDGEEQDAYVLGVDVPVSEFEGRVIGAVRRKNDCEDKLIVAPESIPFTAEEIEEAVRFQERFFDYTIEVLPPEELPETF
jgi:inorganic pyrophosphatase